MKNDKAFTEKEVKDFLASLYSCCSCGKVLYSKETLDEHLLTCIKYQNQRRIEEIVHQYKEYELPQEFFTLLLRKWMKDPRFKQRTKPDFESNPSERSN